MQLHNIQAIVTDIEGTTSSLSFVHEVLFPYSEKKMEEFLSAHAKSEIVTPILNQMKDFTEERLETLQDTVQILRQWIREDRKWAPLKELQGMIWEDGFKKGDFKGHLYEDAFLEMQKWKKALKKIYIYSSGSEKAQRLLFQYNQYGDLSSLFTGYFDTRIGGKKESASYATIVERLQLPASAIVFLSDVEAELNAAQVVGMQTVGLVRYKQTFSDPKTPIVQSFTEIAFS